GKLSLSVSGTDFDAHIDTLSPVDKSPFLSSKNRSIEGNFISNYVITAKLNAKHLIKAGATFQTIYFDALSFGYEPSYGKYINTLNVKASTANLFQSFAHWQYRPAARVTINSGLHYQNFLLNNTSAIEPRLGLRFQLSPRQNLSVGYGMHSQMQPLIYYFYDTYNPATDSYHKSNRGLDLLKSHHVIAGYDLNFAKDHRIKLEAYYQYIYNAPVQKNYNSSFSMINVGNALEGIPLVDSLENSGDGRNAGIEFTIEKFFSNHFYYLATVSVYESKYRGSDRKEHHTSYDGGYVFNTLAGYELSVGKSKNKAFSLDLKYTQSGGNRYTPVDLENSKLAGRAVYRDDEAFSKKLKDYSRFDVKISYKTNRKRTSQSMFLVVENIFDTKNILRESYDPVEQKMKQEYQLGLFPYFGYKIEF
ncbi:MAG: TonB-dependent receptor, partial [Bacteroidetes bacterium]|nr:TonB-dependent receptor [Bacteroidota bacterium]